MHSWFNIKKSINVIYYTNILRKKNRVIISTAGERVFDELQHPFILMIFFKIMRRIKLLEN